jgi:uncharacterized caspase-like protein
MGNGAYTSVAALANPVNDARGIAKNLRELGFEVSEGNNLASASMRRQLNEFLRTAATARFAFVFYAGHGLQVDGQNYLVPIDAKLGAGANVAAQLIDLDTILAGLDDQIRTSIIILDACRDNPFATRAPVTATTGRSVRAGLAAPSSLGRGATVGAGTLLAFATAPGRVALDGEGANSPFSSALLRHIGTPGIEIQQMFTRVRADVVAITRSKQVPWTNSSLLGEVYLVDSKL